MLCLVWPHEEYDLQAPKGHSVISPSGLTVSFISRTVLMHVKEVVKHPLVSCQIGNDLFGLVTWRYPQEV